MIRSFILTCLLAIYYQSSFAQISSNPNEIAQPKVSMLGTFHFAGTTDMAAIKMEDVLGERRQKEIKELVDLLAKYQPTKVLVEYPFSKQDTLRKRYQNYLKGEYTLTSNEIGQVGFRLAKKLGHSDIYAIDHRMELPFQPLMTYCEENNLMGKMEQFIFDIRSFTDEKSKILAAMKLSDFLRTMNTDQFDRISRKIYLQDMLEYGSTGNEVGIDMTVAWYKRNLIMMNNIFRCIEGAQDRVLVLVGSSHRAMIKEFIMDREDVEYVEIADFLNSN